LARAARAPVVARTAPDFLTDVDLVPGTLTVLWHSIVVQYLDAPTRAAFDEAIDRLGAAATAHAPMAHLRMEPDGGPDGRFAVRLRTWPAGEDHDLADAHPHGTWIRWRRD
jgi:hypothetical protein